MQSQDVLEILKIAWPIIIIQLALAAWAIIDIVKKKKTKNLSPLVWVLIALFLNTVGPILYFLLGRVEE